MPACSKLDEYDRPQHNARDGEAQPQLGLDHLDEAVVEVRTLEAASTAVGVLGRQELLGICGQLGFASTLAHLGLFSIERQRKAKMQETERRPQNACEL